MWARLKTNLGLLLAAIVLAYAGAKAVKRKGKATRLDNRAADLEYSGHLDKARAHKEAANRHKTAARDFNKTAKEQLEKLANANEDIEVIAHRFNSERLRLDSEPTT